MLRSGSLLYPAGAHCTDSPDQLPRELVLNKLRGWLENPEKLKVGQNLKYDAHVFANAGITLRGIAHDTLLQSYVFESHRPHDMDNLALRHLVKKPLPTKKSAAKARIRLVLRKLSSTGHRLRRGRCRHHPAIASGDVSGNAEQRFATRLSRYRITGFCRAAKDRTQRRLIDKDMLNRQSTKLHCVC
jgi:hypothetical protein